MRLSRARQYVLPTSCFALVLWLAIAVLSAAPNLHRCLHHDANALDHHCLVEKLSKEPSLLPVYTPMAGSHPEVVLKQVRGEWVTFVSCDLPQAPSRGPPHPVLPTVVAG